MYVYGSGICLLLSATVLGQAPLPKHPTLQQVVSYRLQQHRQMNLRQLPRNSVLYSALLSPGSSNYSRGMEQKNLSSLTRPVVSKVYEQSPAQPAQPSTNLQHYLLRHRQQTMLKQRQWWRDPQTSPGSHLLRNILTHPAPPQ